MIAIRRAVVEDVPLVAPLFDAYRQCYRQAPDLKRAAEFLGDRLQRGESVVFLAESSGEPRALGCGFTQLYPQFSSVVCRPIWILSDLFVAPSHRRHGLGRRLMEAAHAFARDSGGATVELDTAHTNTGAQALYDSLGYRQDEEFRHYVLTL